MKNRTSYHFTKLTTIFFGFLFAIAEASAGTEPVPGYAVGHLRDVSMGPAIVEYLERIDSTLEPFRGRFIVHGGKLERLEGDWSGDLIVIKFPSFQAALDWYNSPAYRKIAPLRSANAQGEIIIINGVSADHRATDILKGASDPQ